MEALVGGEFAGALSFEKEDALAEGVMVVVAGGDRVEEEEYGEDAKCVNRGESIWRHVFSFSHSDDDPVWVLRSVWEMSDEGGNGRGC